MRAKARPRGYEEEVVLRVVLIALYLALCRTAAGTTIIAVWTRAEVVLAADSMVSGGHNFAIKGDMCKIRVIGPTLFASAGFVADFSLQVDVHRIAQETGGGSVREHAEHFSERFLAEMDRVVRWAKEHDREAWSEYQRKECFEAVFAGVEDKMPVLLLRTFRCAADFQGRPFVTVARSMELPW